MTDQTYPVAPNDEARVKMLHDLKILDTASEETFDRVTEMMTIIFNIPTTIVSLVDGERQWFKSKRCLDVSETGRDVAFCNYTIMSDQIFEVTDPQNDERFKNNPLVTGDLGLRYYCGAPIVVRGFTIGALCMLDYNERTPLSADHRKVLLSLANMVSRSINDRRLLRESTVLISELMHS